MTTITAIPPQIIKEAEILRKNLKRGSFNLKELDQFLARVQSYSAPVRRKKKNEDRFQAQLANLDRGTIKKSAV